MLDWIRRSFSSLDSRNSIAIEPDKSALTIAKLEIKKIIKNYTPDAAIQLKAEKAIFECFETGQRINALEKKLEAFVPQRLAKDLAGHSLGMLSAKYNQARHEEIGITKYKWSQSHKGCHDSLNGKVFKYSEPPVADSSNVKAHPGELLNCTCIAVAIIE